MSSLTTGQIEKTAELRALRSRVWRALTDSGEFGTWFGARFTRPFEPGVAQVADLTDEGNRGRKLALRVVALEPETYFAYRWRPHDLDRPVEDDRETTLVEFFLEERGETTRLRIRESGFANIPEEVRALNFRENLQGWDEEAGRLAAYVDVPLSDRIERRLDLRAPVSRVWRAIARPEEFGAWFGLQFEEHEFVPGELMHATITHPAEYAGTPFTITVVDVVPESRFSFRWHPHDIDQAQDRSKEPTTLIEFTLEPRGDETLLTVTESGFDAIPEQHRLRAFRSNDEGWSIQVQRIRRHAEGTL
jgi:uncharacterized protein YndB with AHSA1/START domain